MQTFHRSPFLTIHTEGALLPIDLLQRILAGDKDLPGLAPEDYHLSGEKVNEAINRAWNHLQGAWAAFQTSRGRLKEGDPGTTLTRERWLLPLFQELGYGRLQTAKAIEIEGKSYAISHTWGTAELPTPIHLVGCGVDIEKRQAGVSGASKSSPHSLMQELLNRDETRHWGLVSNGLRLRVLRDNASLTRQAYLEFDLEAMFSGEIYADFAVLWLVCHQSRLEGDKPEAQWLERWSQVAQDQGTRALEGLRSGVEEAIIALGQGFLVHPANQALRQQLKSGKLDRQQYFRQLLRLVYRLIFLFVAEDRDLLLLPEAAPEAKERYLKFYSTARLRRLAERQRGGRHPDLWIGLQVIIGILSGEKMEPQRREERQDSLEKENFASFASSRLALGLPVLGGFLFSHTALPDLEDAQVDNQALLNAVRSLAFTQEKSSRRAVDYKNLGSEELGSVYESLLELQPILNVEAGAFQLTTVAGNERKTTGSYYTNAGLIKITLDSALDPVIAQALERAKEEWNREDSKSAKEFLEKDFASFASLRLIALKICDPACGSGHFLIAAARRIARRLAQLRSGDEEPSPSMIRHALREVIAHCIYGVDINPMAVELCKVNLWLEALEPGKPLTFLDAHIKCGNSLVGVGPGMDVYDLTIPDEAFDPVTGDDKKVASALKKRNKEERKGQLTFDLSGVREEPTEDYAARARQVEAMPEDTPEQVAAKASAYEALQADYQAQHRRLLADLWTAAFFWKLRLDSKGALAAPTQGEWRNARLGKPSLGLAAEARCISEELNFFHWSLEFPDVFDRGGFDCLLGNPPWERIKLQEEEFFAQRDLEIAAAPNKAVRQKLITALIHSNLTLAKAFEKAKHMAECISKFVRESERYPLTAVGDVNSYALFAEHIRNLIARIGYSGIIVPTGIATDDTTKNFFADLTEKLSLASLYDFENRENLFPAVDSRMKFSLLTLSGATEKHTNFVFFATRVEHLRDERRRFSLEPSEIALFNPNTLTMPLFRTRSDAELTRKIYQSVPVLVNENSHQNPWRMRFMAMFHMSNDSYLFVNHPGEGYERLFEGKMVQAFDHRAASTVYVASNAVRQSQPLESSLDQYTDPTYSPKPTWWVPRSEVESRLSQWPRNWLLGIKEITSATNERTLIASLLPREGVGNKIPLLLSDLDNVNLNACLLSNLNCMVLDFVARQKVAGVTINLFILKQFPILPPSSYDSVAINFIAPRVLELVYTAYDLRPFAEDMEYYGEPFRWDLERRALLRSELDAYYAKLYGLTRDELRYILDPQDVYGPDFPGETFRVLKEKEIRQFGEYRTRRLVLEAWDRLEGVEPAKIEKPAAAEPVKEVYAPAVKEKPARAVKEKPVQETPGQPTAMQASFSDFGLYKCGACGKMVMGFDRENHAREAHKGKGVEWVKVK